VLWVRVRRLQKVGPHVAHGCKAHIPAANCRPFLLVVIAGAGCRGTVEGSVAGGLAFVCCSAGNARVPREMCVKSVSYLRRRRVRHSHIYLQRTPIEASPQPCYHRLQKLQKPLSTSKNPSSIYLCVGILLDLPYLFHHVTTNLFVLDCHGVEACHHSWNQQCFQQLCKSR
jgi:hypothetical protein